jgi:hypothetical protein
MLKGFMRDIVLAIQARSGLTPAFPVWLAIIFIAALTAFAFLCVAAYDWISLQLGTLFAALIMAGFFLLVALIGFVVSAAIRRRAKERAILERAARAQAASSWLLDPKILGVAMQAGRSLGWERIVPVVVLGFLAAQWLRRGRNDDKGGADETSS